MTQTLNRGARRGRRTVMPAVAGWARGALLVIALAGISQLRSISGRAVASG